MSMPKQMQFKFECASSVPQTAKQGAEAHSSGWEWVEASVWTKRMLAALGNGVKGGKWSQAVAKCLFR
jgi:RNA-directed DNA polymerase